MTSNSHVCTHMTSKCHRASCPNHCWHAPQDNTPVVEEEVPTAFPSHFLTRAQTGCYAVGPATCEADTKAYWLLPLLCTAAHTAALVSLSRHLFPFLDAAEFELPVSLNMPALLLTHSD
jgi:hypothetical protein